MKPGDLIRPGHASNFTERRSPWVYFRSHDALRVVCEHLDWQGHSPEEIQAMKDGIAGKEPLDD